ncbi:hypothetical protein SAMN05660657_03591 [Geodermatophilus amargosae]|uniref:Uncharacterized protein n=1 Tax=Geodermatophilus amargosae TaxID=1296565 RepID=A0A1I7BI21_9ACTN|nr:hypothetical protein [Geodermatophilus amargosae]SFT86807.1 hypothetical protein SAMN05660657_03591 [Geodermatophilus amargosae]
MTTSGSTTTPRARPRTLQDDLLADLRQAAPMPIARPEAHDSASVRAERSDHTEPETVTVDVRITPLRWSAPSLRQRDTELGLVVTAGPVRISVPRGRGREL